MKIYTKTGDLGKTSLIGGDRVDKDDLRVEAYGTVDELIANISFLRDNMLSEERPNLPQYRSDLMKIMKKLMDLGAVLAAGDDVKKKLPDITDADIVYIETNIDSMSSRFKPVENFVLPGGHPLVSLSNVCRTVCRRAERAAVKASHEFKIAENPIIYLNRLSDYLYLLGRALSEDFKVAEEFWVPGE